MSPPTLHALRYKLGGDLADITWGNRQIAHLIQVRMSVARIAVRRRVGGRVAHSDSEIVLKTNHSNEGPY